MKIKKNVGGRVGGGSGWGVRVEVNEKLKFLGKFTKKKMGGGQVGGRVGGGGVRVDVNAMLGLGGDVGYKIRGGRKGGDS